MKKVMFTAAAAIAMFAMVACNNNKAAEATEDTTCAKMEQCEHKCAHEGDTAMCCKAEGMAQDTTACCKKAEGEKSCKKAEGEKCCKEAAK